MMDAGDRALLILLFLSKFIHNGASSWTITVPSSVKGLPGSCVVIPCSFNYPDPGKDVTGFTGIWTDESSNHVFHSLASKTAQQYHGRTELLGDIRQKSCSLKIDPLRRSDGEPLHFRIEIEGYDKYSYRDNKVSITMMSEPNPIKLSVKEELGGRTLNASCSVSHSCPSSPPVLTWSHSGQQRIGQLQLVDGQWEATSTLTFHPTHADDNKPLICSITHKGGQQQNKSKILQVKYAPVNVKVEYKKNVKEGEAVRLKCTSDANPPAVYGWYDANGAQLYEGNPYTRPNVSRHTGALYCTAINTIGRTKSSPVQLYVLHAPEIKTVSACSSEGDRSKCVCIVESKPPSSVHFLLSDSVQSSTKVETHGSVTIGTLQVEPGSSGFVYCVANNTLGNVKAALALPVNNKMGILYVAIAVGAVMIMLTVLIVVVVVKKRSGSSRDVPPSQLRAMNTHKALELPHHAPAKSKDIYDESYAHSGISTDPVYGNTDLNDDDAIYANM